MLLERLLNDVEYELLKGTLDIQINDIKYDSRLVQSGDVFVCLSGVRSDGHDFIEDVVSKGAVAILVEKDLVVDSLVTVIKTNDNREALALISAAYFDYPARKVKMIGITGTKGKTTTSYMVYDILQKAGIKTGLIGTIETIIGDEKIKSNNTTPQSYLIHEYIKKMVDKGCEAVVMEVSSQGYLQKRVSGITFDYGIFTNLEADHIGEGEHANMADYIRCKGMLFKNCKVGIVNIDDKHWPLVLEGHTCEIETFGMSKDANIRAFDVKLVSGPGSLGVSYKTNLGFDCLVNIPGSFTIYNSLTAIAICKHFNIEPEIIKEALLNVQVKGRAELIKISNRFTLMIDYAHNAMSLESLLLNLKEYHPKRLVCLFGCGGNRSKDRRFEMGEISSRLADLTIATSDNPRFEKPEDILGDIIVGIKKGNGEYISIIDRKEAIRYAILNAKDGDMIVLAGKGHEDYQEICGVKHKMDERDLIKEILSEMTEEQLSKL